MIGLLTVPANEHVSTERTFEITSARTIGLAESSWLAREYVVWRNNKRATFYAMRNGRCCLVTLGPSTLQSEYFEGESVTITLDEPNPITGGNVLLL